MRHTALTAALVAAFFVSDAKAEDEPKMTIEAHIEYCREAHDPPLISGALLRATWSGMQFYEITGPQRDAIVASVNAEEPRTDFNPERVIVGAYSKDFAALIFAFEDDCAWTRGVETLEQIKARIAAAMGTPV